MSARDRIIEAAIEIAATKGVMSLGIDNVNRHAGVSKGAFFYHFKSKDEMVIAMLESVLKTFDLQLQARIDTGSSMLEAMLDVAIHEVQERGALIGSLVAAVSIDPALGDRVLEHSDCWHEQTCSQTGLGPRASALLRLMLDGLIMSTLFAKKRRSADELAQLRTTILAAVRNCDETSEG